MTNELLETARAMLKARYWDANCNCDKCKTFRRLEAAVILSDECASSEPLEQPRISERDYTDAAMHAGLPPPTPRDIQAMNAVIDALYKNREGASRDASSGAAEDIRDHVCIGKPPF